MHKITVLILLLSSQFVSAAACETKRHVMIENSETKVWTSTICPQQKLDFHTHHYARVLIPAEDGVLQVIYQSGRTKTIKLHKEQALFLDKLQGKESHQDVNIGDKPLHLTLIELRNPG